MLAGRSASPCSGRSRVSPSWGWRFGGAASSGSSTSRGRASSKSTSSRERRLRDAGGALAGGRTGRLRPPGGIRPARRRLEAARRAARQPADRAARHGGRQQAARARAHSSSGSSPSRRCRSRSACGSTASPRRSARPIELPAWLGHAADGALDRRDDQRDQPDRRDGRPGRRHRADGRRRAVRAEPAVRPVHDRRAAAGAGRGARSGSCRTTSTRPGSSWARRARCCSATGWRR